MYSIMLRKGAIPLPLAIITKGLSGMANVDSNELIRKVFGKDLKNVLVRPFYKVEIQRSMYSLLFFHDAKV